VLCSTWNVLQVLSTCWHQRGNVFTVSLYLCAQAFINTAREIYKKITDGVFDVSNEVRGPGLWSRGAGMGTQGGEGGGLQHDSSNSARARGPQCQTVLLRFRLLSWRGCAKPWGGGALTVSSDKRPVDVTPV
jgi:hypothetical protein